MVPSEYTNFFITAATSGGALIGLLFVAISLAPERTVQINAPIESRIVAGSTFTALLNAFFISLGGLLPHTNIGWFAITFSIIGVLNSLSQARTLLNPWPSWQNALRRTWLTVVSLYIYITEMVSAIQLLVVADECGSRLLPGTQCAHHLHHRSTSGLGIAGCTTHGVNGMAKSPL